MDTAERRAVIARLRSAIAAGNTKQLSTALPALAAHLADDGQTTDAVVTYARAAEVLTEQGFFLKAAACLRAAEAISFVEHPAVTAAREALLAAVAAADPRLRAIVAERSQDPFLLTGDNVLARA